jgi:hypothetical protein
MKDSKICWRGREVNEGQEIYQKMKIIKQKSEYLSEIPLNIHMSFDPSHMDFFKTQIENRRSKEID